MLSAATHLGRRPGVGGVIVLDLCRQTKKENRPGPLVAERRDLAAATVNADTKAELVTRRNDLMIHVQEPARRGASDGFDSRPWRIEVALSRDSIEATHTFVLGGVF